jgi:hypothetical protein
LISRLSELAALYVLLLDFLKTMSNLYSPWRMLRPGSSRVTPRIKSNLVYLNGNLMVLKIQPLTLRFHRNSRKGG